MSYEPDCKSETESREVCPKRLHAKEFYTKNEYHHMHDRGENSHQTKADTLPDEVTYPSSLGRYLGARQGPLVVAWEHDHVIRCYFVREAGESCIAPMPTTESTRYSGRRFTSMNIRPMYSPSMPNPIMFNPLKKSMVTISDA